MVTPDPSGLAAMQPHERAAFVRRKREEEQTRKQAIHEANEKKRALRRAESAARQALAQDDLVKQCQDESRFPVRLGNLFGPEGNVFNVIGAVRSGIRWAEHHGVYLPDECYAIVNGYMQRTYDETLQMIEDHAIDLDASLTRYYMREKDAANSIGFGDNPIGGFFGQ